MHLPTDRREHAQHQLRSVERPSPFGLDVKHTSFPRAYSPKVRTEPHDPLIDRIPVDTELLLQPSLLEQISGSQAVVTGSLFLDK